MTYDSLANRGDYFSAHYLAEVLPKDLKSGLLATWKEREDAAKARGAEQAPDDALPVTPRAGLRALRRPYFRTRAFFAAPQTADEEQPDTAGRAAPSGDDSATYASPAWRERARSLNAEVLRALGYDAKPRTLTVERADQTYQVRAAHSEKGLVALDCGWAAEPDDALDPEGAGRLLDPLVLDGRTTVTTITTGAKLASFLFACEGAPRYVLLLVGGVIVLADRTVWGEGRYLAASLDTALERNDTRAGGELDTIAALFGADSLRTPEEGGENPLATLVGKSTKHAVGVSSELRDGLRLSVELIANEVLDRIREHGVRPQDVGELPALARQLTRESLRYLYRVLFLLYAEARPELGILPSDYPEYQQGYGLGRLGELVAERDLVDEHARRGTYLYDSLDLLFRMVQNGYRPRRTHGVAAGETAAGAVEAVAAGASEDIGLRFEPLHSTLFEDGSIRLIGKETVPDPRFDTDATGEERFLDTRLRNATLYKVLRLLMLTRGRRGERGGFISYAQLGINQLGAVYEGLMSYSGFVAGEELYEVAKGGDPKDGSWLVPASRAAAYPGGVFVRRPDPETGESVRVRHPAGSFVYRLSGRDRQTSASYYTPESLTRVTVQLALQHRLDQDGTTTQARELLDWRICEPALGSGAFLNEAINQVAAEYLRRRQEELGTAIDTERYQVELQKAKAYIALHNSYGVDLNETAVELAEVSLWLNTMHPGMEAPWFGLHLKRGNSLIGGRREVYPAQKLRKAAWLGTTPERFPLTERERGLPVTVTERKTRSGEVQRTTENAVHHFLLPAREWGAVAAEKEAKALAPDDARALAAWRKAITRTPTTRQCERLQGLARRVEYLWGLVVRRLEISERDISRRIDVWGAEDGWLHSPEAAVQRDEVLADLEAPDTPYWRLKTLMDAWCALWFWPVQKAALLDGTDERYARSAAGQTEQAGQSDGAGLVGLEQSGVLMSWETEDLFGEITGSGELTRESVERRRTGRRKEAIREQRRPVIALANLDDWLDFCEALVGTQDVSAESLVSHFETLEELTPYEDQLPDWMGMDRFSVLEQRFPWAAVARDVADAQGFFHWELDFAQVFTRGGYDLQVGNPPWVRPRWHENVILAELEPWFVLTEKPSTAEWRLQKEELLGDSNSTTSRFFLEELAANIGIVAILGNTATYPLLTGTQPDLYRAFMCQTWKNLSPTGIAGLIHPDTHFGGTKEGRLREGAYSHLRLHAQFMNKAKLFPEISDNTLFGLHIYGQGRGISFTHVSWLFATQTLIESIQHDGQGSVPGVRHAGTWDLRSHRARLISVDTGRLESWRRLTDETDVPLSQTPLLYPVTTLEQGAIDALGKIQERLGAQKPWISRGYDEANGKRDGYIRWANKSVTSLEEVVLQGPHFGGALPFAKEPKIPCRSNNDWIPLNIEQLEFNFVPKTNYVRACSTDRYKAAQDSWGERRYTEYFRLAWRRMIPFNSERSLFAALIPPGPTHVYTVQSLALENNQSTALNSGFWASLPMDYLLRITGRADLTPAGVRQMPAPASDHPLTHPLLLRTLRLNSLTSAYAPLWEELFHPTWPAYEEWAHVWPNLPSLVSGLTAIWDYRSPLRSEYERRAALVELDALVSVWLGITADQLLAIYGSRFPVLAERESEMYFDTQGRKIARDSYAYGHSQTKETYPALLAHLENPATTPPPAGYTPPFYKADRETEMRAAHAHFQARLDAEIAAGRWSPSAPARAPQDAPNAHEQTQQSDSMPARDGS